MTSVTVNTYTHSATYVADNILKSLKDIIRLSGLDPAGFAAKWETHSLAVGTWLKSGHLEKVTLEIYDPKTNGLIFRWDIEIAYGWSGNDGAFWTDTEQLKYAIKKSGVVAAEAQYDLLLYNKSGYADVAGWGDGSARSTTGMVRQSLGTTIEHSGLGARTSYLRKP